MQKLEEEIRLAQSNVSVKKTGAWMKVAGFLFISLVIYFDQPLLLEIFASLFSGYLLLASLFEFDAVWHYQEATILPKKKELKQARLVALIREETRSAVKSEIN